MKSIVTFLLFFSISLGAVAGCGSQVHGMCNNASYTGGYLQQVPVTNVKKIVIYKHHQQHGVIKHQKVHKVGKIRHWFQKHFKTHKKPMKTPKVHTSTSVNASTPHEVSSIGNEITGAPFIDHDGSPKSQPEGLFTRMYHQAKWVVVHIFYVFRWFWRLL